MTLNPEQQKLLDQLVESGLFESPDQVIDTALRLLAERKQKLADLKKEILKGFDSGPPLPGEEVMDKPAAALRLLQQFRDTFRRLADFS